GGAGGARVGGGARGLWRGGGGGGGGVLGGGRRGGGVLTPPLARQLRVRVGDAVTLFLQNADTIPRETLLGKRKSEDVLSKLDVTVKAILPEEGVGRFTLRPGPGVPLNAFVPLRLLQGRYDPDRQKAPLEGRVNALLVGGANGSLQAALRRRLDLEDWGLVLRTPEGRGRQWATLLAARGDDPAAWDGKLRRFRWQGRVPEELAAQAEGGQTLHA